jgi:hypothetical protein
MDRPDNGPLELDELVYSYPDVRTPGFQTLISAKEEFRELASDITEAVPNRGQFFKHQILVHRYMLIYDRLLLIHRTGTGKTCAAGGTSEMFKRSVINATGDFINLYMKPQRTHIKHVYILVRGPTLKAEFKRELVCRCAPPGEYENTPLVRNAKTVESRKSNITRELNKYYTVTSYRRFAEDIEERGMSDQDIKQAYSGSLFIFDEIHNLRVDPLKPEDERDQRRYYDILHRVFHQIERSKVMLLTATPMINEAWEIAPIMDLILPEDMQMPNQNEYDYTNPKIEDLEPYFRGRVSYVRELDTIAKAEYQGTLIEAEYEIGGRVYASQQVVMPTEMSGPVVTASGVEIPGQAAGYRDSILRTDKRDAFHERERQASNFVFPDGSYGNTTKAALKQGIVQGFNKYVIKEGEDKYRASEELLPWLANLEYLKILSSKYAEIVRLSMESPGNVYCFSNFITGSGAIVLSLCFEAQGFAKFTETSSVFVAERHDPGGLRPYCPEQRSAELDRPTSTDRPTRIAKGVARYALLTSETSAVRFQTILETFNSAENRHGELIKVLIVSPVGREGINTANVVQIHLTGPDWNQASTYQAISRAIRATSHVDLLREERARLALDPNKNEDDAIVPVRIYQHAAIPPQPEGGQPEIDITETDAEVLREDERATRSIDIMMYQHSEVKDIEIKKVERIMKRVSVDCQIHHNRNVRVTDEDYTSICDYDVCNYECYDPPPEEVDRSSYDVIYSGPLIEAAIFDLKNLFRSVFSITFDGLYQRLRHYRTKFVDAAVERVISEKMPLTDRFGYRNYLREDGGTIFLQRDYPLVEIANMQDNYGLSEYSKTLIGIEETNLSQYVSGLRTPAQIEIIQQIRAIAQQNPESPEIDRLIDTLPPESRISLLEKALIDITEGRASQLGNRIITKYRRVIFNMPEPVELIETTAMALANRGKTRGRKPKAEGKPTVPKIVLEEGKTGSDVYIHVLYGEIVDRVSYSVTPNYTNVAGKIRVLKPSEGTGWRDASPPERLVYAEIISNERRRQTDVFNQYDLYGSVYQADGVFRIHNKLTEKTDIAKGDKRHINRGKMCKTWHKPDLIGFLWHLKINPVPDPPIDRVTREEMIRKLSEENVGTRGDPIASFPLDKLQFYYKWYISGRSRDQICNILQRHFRDTNRLLIA